MPRTPEKFGQVLAVMRRRIVRGTLRPGERLPVRADLEQEFAASSGTVQRVFDALARDGFVEARGQSGTFVAPRPPHLCQYALVFLGDPNDNHSFWSRAYDVLVDQAALMSRTGNRRRRFRCYFGVDGHPDSEGYRALVGDVRAARLAGLIFVHGLHQLEQTPIVQDHDIPMVAISSGDGTDVVSVIAYDNDSFINVAADQLTRAGRKRVAVLSAAGTGYSSADERLARAFAARDLHAPRQWWQYAYPHDAHAARNAAHLIAHASQPNRPDALLITDDHLLAPALHGFTDAGAPIGTPDGVEVVSHWNFPLPFAHESDPGGSTPRVTLVGFDARVALAKAVDLLDARRARQSVPRRVTVDAVVQRDGEMNPGTEAAG